MAALNATATAKGHTSVPFEMTEQDVQKVLWDVIDRAFMCGGGPETPNPLVRHQIETFNEFVDKKMGQIIQGFNPIQICHNYNETLQDFSYKIFLHVLNPTLTKPTYTTQDGAQILMTPHIARMNNLTYAVQLNVNVNVVTEVIHDDMVIERNEVIFPSVTIGKIPIMVRSKACMLVQMTGSHEMHQKNECRYDPGGYFIVNGNEKVVISQDRISENKTLVFGNADGMSAEIRSVPDGMFSPPKTTSIHMGNKPNHLGRILRANATFLRNDVPLFVLFRALGIESDHDIIHHIALDVEDPRHQRLVAELSACAEDASEVHTQAEALAHLMKHMGMMGTPKEYLEQPEIAQKVVRQVLANDLLPHVGHSFRRKALYLGYMTRKLLRVHLGYQSVDNRDNYLFKRVDTPGVLVSNLFRQCYGKMIKEMRSLVQREIHQWRASPTLPAQLIHATNIHRFFKQNIIETGLKYALSTGNWGVKTLGSFQNIRAGVAQVLNRLSYLSTISHMRRINTPMEKNGKLVQPRKLENTQFGMICPAETPEGGSVGLVKNMAMSAHVTTATNSLFVRKTIEVLGACLYDDNVPDPRAFLKEMGSGTVVHLTMNGDLVGFVRDPVSFYASLKSMKRRGVIPPTTSIAWNVPQHILSISTEAGRLVRPLLVVEVGPDGTRELRLLKRLRERPELREALRGMKFHDMVADLVRQEEGFIEYLDVEELDNAMVAMLPADLTKAAKGESMPPNYTHCELHPSLMLGALACNIPFSDHNQSPRNCYSAAMQKQAVGIFATNYERRVDTMGHILNSGQRPLASPRMSKYTHMTELPSGVNAIVAIMTYSGFNQEDSVMINQSALDRGLFATTYYKAYRDLCTKNHSTGEEEQFGRPDPVCTSQMKQPYNYSKLGDDGFVPLHTHVKGNDVLIGKVMPHKVQGALQPRDASVAIKSTDEGKVDFKYASVNGEGYKFCKVRLRQYMRPTIGDKVTSQHAQKGTIGMVYRQQDMPYNAQGMSPDIIVNPHAIPSRMTIGQLLECIMGKAACCLGALGDATPFNDCTAEDLSKILEAHGLERHGNEVIYDGRTGRAMETLIFMGPTSYQRLKHYVGHKWHSRGSNGPVVMLTRQPSEGRARNGGLRFGEMERDAIVAHGASAFLKERMLDVSDNFRLFVCKTCGMPCIANPEKKLYTCKICKNDLNVAQIRLPYCMKLLMQELMSMSVAPRMVVQ